MTTVAAFAMLGASVYGLALSIRYALANQAQWYAEHRIRVAR